MEIEISSDSLEFNSLPHDTKVQRMWDEGKLINPFSDEAKNMTMMNPFTFETVNGTMDDGEHMIRNPFTMDIIRKVLFEGGKPIKAWVVNDNGDGFDELPRNKDGTWDTTSGDK